MKRAMCSLEVIAAAIGQLGEGQIGAAYGDPSYKEGRTPLKTQETETRNE